MEINFGYLFKRWCSVKVIEVGLCGILISKDTSRAEKNFASLLKIEIRIRQTTRRNFVRDKIFFVDTERRI